MKICFKCKEQKETTQFYRHPYTSDGFLGKCKSVLKKTIGQVMGHKPENVLNAIKYLRRQKLKSPEVVA